MYEALGRVIASTLGLAATDVSQGTSMSNCPAWDSLKHFEVILAIENEFQVRFPMDAIPEMTSVARLQAAWEGDRPIFPTGKSGQSPSCSSAATGMPE